MDAVSLGRRQKGSAAPFNIDRKNITIPRELMCSTPKIK
jgi:hypothetical protein